MKLHTAPLLVAAVTTVAAFWLLIGWLPDRHWLEVALGAVTAGLGLGAFVLYATMGLYRR